MVLGVQSVCVGPPRNAKIYCILLKFTRFSLYPDLFKLNNVCVFICTFNKKRESSINCIDFVNEGLSPS